jgi:3',5'-cyclic AMP phosphodiesterase CpdA
MADTIRLAHFSDIHITAPQLEWRAGDWFSKRLTSWLNHRLGRAHHFARAEEIVALALEEWQRRGVEHLVFSGDATALGFEAEIRRAAECLRVGQAGLPGLAVPGNHDYCTRSAAASGNFERWFAPWQQGRRIDEHPYPFAQAAGPAWLIGVNAATGNRWPWDATGAVGAAQLERLRQLLGALPADAVKILVLHFPICLSDGRPEARFHGLRDLDALLEVAHAGGVDLWLHGHRHRPYAMQRPGAGNVAFPVICAGTATQHGIWSHGEYTITRNTLHAIRRIYDPDGRCFRDAETFSLQLKQKCVH